MKRPSLRSVRRGTHQHDPAPLGGWGVLSGGGGGGGVVWGGVVWGGVGGRPAGKPHSDDPPTASPSLLTHHGFEEAQAQRQTRQEEALTDEVVGRARAALPAHARPPPHRLGVGTQPRVLVAVRHAGGGVRDIAAASRGELVVDLVRSSQAQLCGTRAAGSET
jgi:hypothetical protein